MVTVLEEVRAELSRESYVPCLTGTEPYKKVHILAAQHADMLLALADAAAGLDEAEDAFAALDNADSAMQGGWWDARSAVWEARTKLAEAIAPLLAESAAGTEG